MYKVQQCKEYYIIMSREYLNDINIFIFGLLLSFVLIIPIVYYKIDMFYIPIPFILSIIIIIIKMLCNYLDNPEDPRDIGYQYMEYT